jgi:hypothetical protein
LPLQPLQARLFLATVIVQLSCSRAITMRSARARSLALAALGVASLTLADPAAARPGPGTSQRDCQVVRACNFGRGGLYRGCISSYSCRVCRFVRASCKVGGVRGVCQRMRCDWGL